MAYFTMNTNKNKNSAQYKEIFIGILFVLTEIVQIDQFSKLFA